MCPCNPALDATLRACDATHTHTHLGSCVHLLQFAMDDDGKVIKVAYEQRSIGDLGTGDRGAKRHTTMPVTEDDMVELYNERKDRQLVKDSSRECTPRSPLDLDHPSSSRSDQIRSACCSA